MRLGRAKPTVSAPMTLPERGETVTLSTLAGGRIPARVLERTSDSVLVAVTVPTRPWTPAQLKDMIMECSNARGRLRLRGTFAVEDPADPDVLRLLSPRSIELLQQRHHVRIEAARPVIVYGARGGAQAESFTVDLSGGGFLLAGPESLSLGEEVRFRLTLTPGMVPVTGTARVVRTTDEGRSALAFESISDLDRRRLVRFIFECQRDERHRGIKGRS